MILSILLVSRKANNLNTLFENLNIELWPPWVY